MGRDSLIEILKKREDEKREKEILFSTPPPCNFYFDKEPKSLLSDLIENLVTNFFSNETDVNEIINEIVNNPLLQDIPPEQTSSTDSNIAFFIADLAVPCGDTCSLSQIIQRAAIQGLAQDSLTPDCPTTINFLFGAGQTVYNERAVIFNGVTDMIENDTVNLAYTMIVFFTVPIVLFLILFMWVAYNHNLLPLNQIIIILILFLIVFILGVYFAIKYINSFDTINNVIDLIGDNLSDFLAQLEVYREAKRLNLIAKESYCKAKDKPPCTCS